MVGDFRTFVGRRYDSLEPVKICVLNDKIVSVTNFTEIGRKLPFVAPGLFDIQVNGAVGVEFSSSKLTEEGVIAVLDKMLHDGVFRICPTLTTNAPETMIAASRIIANALKKQPEYAPIVWGIHLEGPFISTAEGAIGAHPKKYCLPYSKELFEHIQQAACGIVKIVTLSPEYPNAGEFVEYLHSQGILVAIGHTNADNRQLNLAIDAGSTLSTHLSNATRHLLPKWENYFFAQLADDRLVASIILDGFHISPQLARAIVRCKGLEHLLLISDQSPLAGFPPGKYSMELCDFEIQSNGKVTLAGDPNLLACASFPVGNGVANLMTIENLPLSKVYPLASTQPAKLLGAPKYSSGDDDYLKVGGKADFLLFNVRKATFGKLGILDGKNFCSGALEFEKIIWHGREII